VARQPIFDRNRHVFGYELLFRSSKDALSCNIDCNEASLSTLDTSLFIGHGSLSEGRRAFLNCTRELLVNDLITAIPRDLTVIEILETAEPDAEVIAACARLKRAGYTLALDDFDFTRDRSALVPFADIIKVDFQTTSPQEQRQIADRYAPLGISMLAEKVETQDEFEIARACGYSYFQGYFFCRPVTIAAADIPALQLNYFRILQTAFQSELDLFGLESAIKTEPALCYRLLRYLNSAAFAVYPVTSIRHALALLGSKDLRKWIAIMAAITIAGPNSAELVVTALARARFCEALAFPLQITEADLFLLGLLSLIDALLDQPIERILAKLSVQTTIRDTLLGLPSPLQPVLSLARACERGDWQALEDACTRLILDENQVWYCYSEALKWARELHRQTESGK
jgi:EAL and modified HD-GYP domain-containing signal transduction protein